MRKSGTSEGNVVPLFRERAVEASEDSRLVLDLERTGPSRNVILALVCVCIVVAGGFLANSGMAAIETRGTAVLLPAPVPLRSQQEAVVHRLFVTDGQRVVEGQKILETAADYFDAERASGASERRLAEIRRQEMRLLEERESVRNRAQEESKGTERRSAMLDLQLRELDSQIQALQSVADARRKDLAIVANLTRQQVSSDRDESGVTANYFTALANKLELDVQRAALASELTKLDQEAKLQKISAASDVQRLTSQLDLLEIERRQIQAPKTALVRAPVGGRIEFLGKGTGAVIRSGEVVATVIPEDREWYGTFNLDPALRSQLADASGPYTVDVPIGSTVQRVTATLEQISEAPVTGDQYLLKLRLSGQVSGIADGTPLTLHVYQVRPNSLLGAILSFWNDIADTSASEQREQA